MRSIRFALDYSLLLIFGTIAALVWANLAPDSYRHLLHTELLGISFHFWVNDILMCLFFGLAAKEIWEALLPGGSLSSPAKAATPLLATVGGVVGPAGLYVAGAIAFGATSLVRGWAVPTATDIAFSYLVARLIFGAKHPAIPFLLLLAIADDAIGLVILAVFYPQESGNLLLFATCVVGAIAFNTLVLRRALRSENYWAYLAIAAPLSWYGFHAGGIHPALALVPIIPTLPHAEKDEGLFVERTLPQPPGDALNRFEHAFKHPVEVVLMLFGLANAGVAFGEVGLATALVAAALLIGKPLGIAAMTGLALRFGLGLPQGMTMRDVVVVGATAGIGFTVALFVCGVAFEPGPAMAAAKLGALLSFAAAGVAFVAAKLLKVRRVSDPPTPEDPEQLEHVTA